MSSESPVVELYSSDGYELPVVNNAVTPTGTRALLVAGSDGTNTRFILVDGSARQIVAGAGVAGTPAGGVLTIQGVSGGTVVPVSFTAQSGVAATPPTSAIYIGGSVTTAAPAYSTGQMNALSLTLDGGLRIDGVYALTTIAATAANATQVGGSVTTASPTYTTGTLNALSLDTSGNLRVTSGATDTTATGALNALNAAVQVILAGKSSVGFQLAAGTLIGTIVAEMSSDGGTTWNATYFDQTAGNKVSSVTFASANTALGSTMIGEGGSGLARIRVSAYTSGTANITLRASTVSDPSTLTGGVPGSTVPPLATFIGGSVTTTAPTYTNATLNALSLDTSGNVRVTGSFTSGYGYGTTFSSSTNGVVAGITNTGTTTSLAYLIHTAASTKRIEIQKIEVFFAESAVNIVGMVNIIGGFITAEAGTPGGTVATIIGNNQANVADTHDTFRYGATGAPTRSTGDAFVATYSPATGGTYIWTPSIAGQPITLRAGVLEGFEIRTITTTTFGSGASSPDYSVNIQWIEI